MQSASKKAVPSPGVVGALITAFADSYIHNVDKLSEAPLSILLQLKVKMHLIIQIMQSGAGITPGRAFAGYKRLAILISIPDHLPKKGKGGSDLLGFVPQPNLLGCWRRFQDLKVASHPCQPRLRRTPCLPPPKKKRAVKKKISTAFDSNRSRSPGQAERLLGFVPQPNLLGLNGSISRMLF